MAPWDRNSRNPGEWRGEDQSGYRDWNRPGPADDRRAERGQRDAWSRDSRDRSRDGRERDGRPGYSERYRDDRNGREARGASSGGGRRYEGNRRYVDDRDHRSDRVPIAPLSDRVRDRGSDRGADRPPAKAHVSRDSGRGSEKPADEAGDRPCCIWLGGLPNTVTEREIEKLCSKHGSVLKVTIKTSLRDTFSFVQYSTPGEAKEAIIKLDQVEAFGSGIIKVAPASRKVQPGDQKPAAKNGNDGALERKRPRGPAHEAERPAQRVGRQDYQRERPRTPPANTRERTRTRSRDGGRGGRDRDRARAREPSPPASPEKPMPYRIHLSQLPIDMDEEELKDICGDYGKIMEFSLHKESSYKCGWVEFGSKAEADAAVADLDDRSMDDWSMRLQAYAYPRGY